MTNLQQRMLAAFGRVTQFFQAHGSDFTAGSPAAKAFADIAAETPKAGTDAGTQAAGKGESKAGTAGRSAVRIALHGELASINLAAHGMALTMPGLDQKFRLPRSGSDQALLASAVAFIADATPLKADFIAHEMPTDFLDVTQALVDQFKATGVDQNAAKEKQVGGTAAVKDDTSKGAVALELLKSVVPNKYRNNPVVLAEWLSACHVERPSHHKKPAPPAPPR